MNICSSRLLLDSVRHFGSIFFWKMTFFKPTHPLKFGKIRYFFGTFPIKRLLEKYIYLVGWCHLSVKIFGWMCIHEIFRVSLNPYGELIFQFSAQFSPWIASVTEGQVLAPFT